MTIEVLDGCFLILEGGFLLEQTIVVYHTTIRITIEVWESDVVSCFSHLGHINHPQPFSNILDILGNLSVH